MEPMKMVYEPHELNRILDNVPSGIEFDIIFRKSEDVHVSTSKGNVNPVVVAALNSISEKYSLETNLLSFVSSVYVDDNGPGVYEIFLSFDDMPKQVASILFHRILDEEFEVSLVDHAEVGLGHSWQVIIRN